MALMIGVLIGIAIFFVASAIRCSCMGNFRVYKKAALNYGAAGKFPQAKKKWQKCLELDEHSEYARMHLAMLDEWERGLVSAQCLGHIYKGSACSLTNYDNAKKEFEKAIGYNAAYHRAYAAAGSHALINRKNDSALQYYLEAYRLCPDNTVYTATLSALYLMSKDYMRAKELAKKALEKGPPSYIAYCQVGDVYYEQGSYSEASGYYRKASELGPGRPRCLLGLGICCMKMQKYPEAKEFLNKALAAAKKSKNMIMIETIKRYLKEIH